MSLPPRPVNAAGFGGVAGDKVSIASGHQADGFTRRDVHSDASVLGDAQRITVGVLEPGYAATPW
jgi:hypothetical protein